MQIAFVLYDRFTALDVVGPYDVLCRIPDVETVFVGERTGPVRNDRGALGLVADAALDDVTRPDVVVVPGGPGQAALMDDGPLHAWLRSVDRTTTWTTTVCTGSLVLAAAGLLRGRRATSHWLALDQLPAHGVEPVRERCVIDGKYVTAGGVSSGLDMAFALAGRIAGDTVARMIQLALEYDPRPPFDAGSPETAPSEIVEAVRGMSRFVLYGE